MMKMKPLKNELVVEIKDILPQIYFRIVLYIDVILRMSQKPKTITCCQVQTQKKNENEETELTVEEDDIETVVAVVDNLVELYKPTEEKEEEEINEEVDVKDRELNLMMIWIIIKILKKKKKEQNETASELEEEDDEYYGGEDTPENPKFKANIDGMPIKNPSPFFKRMMELDPTLFVTEESSKFPLYSKACPSGDKRQPVILTDEEKKRIDETNPGSYGHALHYGSSEDKKHWYICPRYWCLKTNSSISEEDVRPENVEILFHVVRIACQRCLCI
jgi:hypothetical protein